MESKQMVPPWIWVGDRLKRFWIISQNFLSKRKKT
jgi:hypothetical protein